ncbi:MULTISPECIES: SsgA family sporulation/cell division regulator [unclassified Streptomyces]|uniref:SsgA family sporulation/cell division regulator n=1 Tax=unclassified Streptomyces TaxID=2593676 RepID=UPI0022867C23|nr:SsgA family sporulation/cell division regulator [Streptomyces sp. Je 1-369]WAL99720.1 SsgA family sporulation/cell division regulator [Streptomyces sp. Je 1-369]
MAVTLEQPARARLITPEGRERALSVVLRYSAEDPLAIQMVFPSQASLDGAEVTWIFARQLLEEGMAAPAGSGDVHIWPCGRARTVLEFHSHQGLALVQFDKLVLRRFLVRSYAVVPAGGEEEVLDLDRGLSRLLDGV